MNLGQVRIVDICDHYKPAVIYEKDEPTVTLGIFGIGKRKNQPAYSKMKRIDKNVYVCSHCGIRLNEKENAQIDKIVDYLNSGGNSEWKLAAMFKGLPVSETFRDGHKDRVEIVEATKGYVPVKNSFK